MEEGRGEGRRKEGRKGGRADGRKERIGREVEGALVEPVGGDMPTESVGGASDGKFHRSSLRAFRPRFCVRSGAT